MLATGKFFRTHSRGNTKFYEHELLLSYNGLVTFIKWIAPKGVGLEFCIPHSYSFPNGYRNM